jgi:hypothetical protein
LLHLILGVANLGSGSIFFGSGRLAYRDELLVAVDLYGAVEGQLRSHS